MSLLLLIHTVIHPNDLNILLLVDVVLNNQIKVSPAKFSWDSTIWIAAFWQSATVHRIPCIDILFICSFHEFSVLLSIKRSGLLLRYWTPACLMSKWWLGSPYNWWETAQKKKSPLPPISKTSNWKISLPLCHFFWTTFWQELKKRNGHPRSRFRAGKETRSSNCKYI